MKTYQTNNPGNYRVDELARGAALLLESCSIELNVPFVFVKLAIARIFFRDANLSWANEESCSTARLIRLLMDRRCTNQLLGFGRDIISITVAMVTGHCVMGRHKEIMTLPFNDLCR